MKKVGRNIVCIISYLFILTAVAGCGHANPSGGYSSSARDDAMGYTDSGYVKPLVEEHVVDDAVAASASDTDEQRAAIGLDDRGIVQLKNSQAPYYCYSVMDASLHDLYVEVYTILNTESEDIVVSSTDTDDLNYVFQCVLNDHPEIYWVTGYSYVRHEVAGVTQCLTFSGKYTYSLDERMAMQSYIDDYVKRCESGIRNSASDYDKVRYVYDYLIDNTEYDMTAPDNQNIISVFVNGRSICQGYAKAFQYLLNDMGIDCTIVIGVDDNGEGHAWNLVNVDGAYYYCDVTWGDARYIYDGSGHENDMPTNYNYLNITTAELQKTHVIDNVVPLPECYATEANYYVHEGLYLNSYDYYLIKQAFENAYDNREEAVTLKCDSYVSFCTVYEELIDNMAIFDMMSGNTDDVTYTYDEDVYTLTFWI